MKKIAYKCHILVCVNDREGKRESCADNNAKEIRSILKKKVKSENWHKEDIRVSQSLCLGLCSSGPNVLLYPQNIQYSNVTVKDIPSIIEKIKEIMK